VKSPTDLGDYCRQFVSPGNLALTILSDVFQTLSRTIRDQLNLTETLIHQFWIFSAEIWNWRFPTRNATCQC